MTERTQPVLRDVRLEGSKTLLRPVNPGDARIAFESIHQRREILDWLVWQGPDDELELEGIYSNWITRTDNGTNYHFAVLERATERFCGTIGLRFLDHPWVGDVGYWIARDAWGRGLATEASFLVAHLAFRHLQATVLTAEVFVGNEASARVLDKTGYTREPAVQTRPLPGAPGPADREQWMYTLTRARFESRFAGSTPVMESVHLEGS